MRFDILCGVPALLKGPFNESILKRAQQKNLVKIIIHDLHDYAYDKHRKIDDVPFGGEAGMVLKPEPIFECIETLKRERTYDEIIYLSADGERFQQSLATEFSLKQNLIFLCGHYKGVDERVREQLITKEISIGDYVLTGGELAAAVVIDATVRLIPGVVSNAESLLNDSFQNMMLDAPSYTRPAEFRSMKVPEVLLSGDPQKIAVWRDEKRLEKTKQRRNDLIN
ncbi:MAG: tRNA (guanosine(37)-N1)-methyltransferase TrmD [Ignavibacteria bacterium]|nr:tRNA (guanosine(37)-N1)-methyltransferase TrmD [Ignavibacteria bacterium]